MEGGGVCGVIYTDNRSNDRANSSWPYSRLSSMLEDSEQVDEGKLHFF